jgi:prepilin-type processing-associated H-X9-DG protein
MGKDWVRFAGPTILGLPQEEQGGSWSRQSSPGGFKGGCFIMSGGDEKLVPNESPAFRRPAQALRLTEITKGLTKTVAFSEVIRQASRGTDGTDDRRGLTMWGPGSLFTTQRRPNGSEPDVMPWPGNCGEERVTGQVTPPCYAPHYAGEPYAMAARSRHPDGVVVAFCDGHIRFIDDSIGAVEWANMGTTREDVTVRTE